MTTKSGSNTGGQTSREIMHAKICSIVLANSTTAKLSGNTLREATCVGLSKSTLRSYDIPHNIKGGIET